MKTSSLTIAAVLAATTFGAGWALAHAGTRTPPRPAQASTAETAEASPREVVAQSNDGRLDRTDERVQALEQEVSSMRSHAKPGEGHARRVAGPPLDPKAEAEQIEQRFRNMTAYVTSQGRDAAWASGYEARLTSYVSHVKGVEIKENRCYSSACRLQVGYASEEGRTDLLRELASQFSANDGPAAMFYQPVLGDDGKPSLVLEVFRHGSPPPPALM